MIEVGPPGSAGCWGVTKVAVHYHVGSRHYTAVARESLSGCTPLAELAPDGTGAIAPPSASPSASPATSVTHATSASHAARRRSG